MSDHPVDYEHLAGQHYVLARMDSAEDFPHNTCPASRIAAGVAEALITGRPYPLLTEEQRLCGEMIAATVAALWELRTEVALMKKNWMIRKAIDYFHRLHGVPAWNELKLDQFSEQTDS